MALPAVKLPHPATLADLAALPPNMKGELIEGVLYAMTRPRAVHQEIAGAVCTDLTLAFQRGRGGPGGWWILPEPGIELPGAPEVSPDVAGWRRERLPTLPADHAISVVPDWVCEVLSPTTRGYQLLVKRRLYASAGVPFLWEIDREAQTLSVLRLSGGQWLDLGAYREEEAAQLPPFEATPINVRGFWPDDPAG
ncbi:MAG: Uma2 family endonuclease [Polyangiaceae bacterium]